MPQMFLENPEAIAGIILLHSHDGKSILELVGRDIVYLCDLGVYQFRQARFVGTSADYSFWSVTKYTPHGDYSSKP